MSMSFTEVMARLSTTLVAWLCVYAYVIWLATLRVVSCTADGDTLWAVLLGFGCFVAPLAWFLNLTRPLEEVHAVLRHFVWPLILLAPLAAIPVYSAWIDATWAGHPVCSTVDFARWHAWWAPAQTILLFSIGWSIHRATRLTTRSYR